MDTFTRALSSLRQGCYDDAAQFCSEVLENEPAHAQALHVLGVIAVQQGRLNEAEEMFRQAAEICPSDARHHLNLANVLRARDNVEKAGAAYRAAAEAQPGALAAWAGWAYSAMPGDHYRDLLRSFHGWLEPDVYLEIGIESGRALSLARPPTQAIGIDPKPMLQYTFQAPTRIFRVTSDEFFSAQEVREQFGPVNMAFLDGLHLFEQTLRDFINIERQAHQDGVVLIHDCLPLHPRVAQRNRQTEFWTGDTWKVIPILKQFRPDLEVLTIASAPTGLGVVTRLDPGSTVLEELWEEIMDQWLRRQLPEDDAARRKELSAVESDFASIRKHIEKALNRARAGVRA
jgi:tetratricopeptide (TPR) repeat protein